MNINKNGVWKQNCLHERTLPEGYMQLEYIESTGTQYIDLGLKGNLTTCAEIKFNKITASNYNVISLFGDNTTSSLSIDFILPTSSNNARNNRFGNKVVSVTEVFSLNTIYTLKINKIGTFINNVLKIIYNTSTDFTTASNLLIFRCGGLSNTYWGGTSRIYYFKLWDNNVLIRDMVPAQRISDGVIGMYDIINNIFYTNAGTGVFQGPTCTEDYTRLDYIESDGTQYIDTGIKGDAKHYYEIAWLKTGATRQLLGYGGNSREYWGLNNKNTGKLELGGNYYTPTVDITKKQKYEWDYNYANSINKVYLNDTLILSSNPNPSVNNTSVKFLNIYASTYNYICNLKVYSYIIKDWNDNLLAHYIPVKRNSDDKIGLFEIVSQTFVQSGNQNNFITGSNYIQTDNVKIYKNNKSIEANDFIEL